jgi:hypothetical protein
MNEKYPDSPKDVDIKAICLDSRFGELNFADVVELLNTMQSEIVELEEMDYAARLTQVEINQVNGARNSIIKYIKDIKEFSITQPNSSQTRDSIIQNIQSYYQNSFAQQVRPQLLWLRDKVKSSAKSEAELRKLITKTDDLAKDLEIRLAKIKKDEESVEQKSGIVSAKYLSTAFTTQNTEALNDVAGWNKKINISMVLLFLVVGGLFWGYVEWARNLGSDIRIEYGVFSAAIIGSVLFYIKFVVRNYNITNHIASGNKHRANVAETLESFLVSAGQDTDLKGALLKEGAVAMFQADATGYLSKDQIEIGTPIKEIATTIINKAH